MATKAKKYFVYDSDMGEWNIFNTQEEVKKHIKAVLEEDTDELEAGAGDDFTVIYGEAYKVDLDEKRTVTVGLKKI
jgi:hypothetical protein